MRSSSVLTLGAVAYDAKVVPIWDGFKAWFATRGLAFDYVLYTNYERQVDAHMRGEVDVAWNSPLAWIQAGRLAAKHGRKAEAIAMRDTDRDLTSVVLVREDSAVRSLADLRGKRVGVGAADSPQATLIPLLSFAEAGVDVEVVRHDVLLGKHGDHVGRERDAVKALPAGNVDRRRPPRVGFRRTFSFYVEQETTSSIYDPFPGSFDNEGSGEHRYLSGPRVAGQGNVDL